ncbi:MAG: amidohydrolase [Acidobacteriota bacterium]|nr:amidohydrolase [Acidobacteriota bacterium]MDH3528764.1 amidohydrolase [Acidobacteriota bacterium]
MKKLLVFVCLFVFAVPSFAKDMSSEIAAAAERINPQVIKWRRHFHENPELSNREFKTAEMVAAHMRSLGFEVREKVGKTGVVAILKGGMPGPVIGLRADMDALPVKERVDIPFASKVTADYLGTMVPVMHACGHDTHIAILMGTAEVLAGMKDKIKGTVVFIFQPAEEGPPGDEEGGAELMVKEGVMDNPKIDAIFGLHINSQTEIGQIGYKSGAAMASSDWFTVKIKGKQAHGSAPWAGVDPIVTATQIIQGFQTIVSRQSMLTRAPVVITVGKINAGVRENIIPETLEMAGTIRTLDSDMQKDVHERMRNTVRTIAESQGATATIEIDTKTLVTSNTPALVEQMLPSLYKAAGRENVFLREWTTGAEDFSYFGEKAPSFYFFLGGMPKGQDPAKAPGHHTPDFYLDDSRLDVGVKAFCNIVFDYSSEV